MVDDGRVSLRVHEHSGNQVLTEVVVGGKIGSHKGVNIPGVVLPISVITDKDRRDLAYGLSAGRRLGGPIVCPKTR